MVPLLLTRPLSGPLALRPLGTLRQLEELLELFVAAGFDPHGALHAARLFTGFLYGHVLHELQDQIDNPDETDDLLRLGLHRLPLTQFPRLRSLAAVLATYDGAAELDEGLSHRARRPAQPTAHLTTPPRTTPLRHHPTASPHSGCAPIRLARRPVLFGAPWAVTARRC